MRDVVEADAAVLLGDGATEQTERRHLAQHVLREGLAAIALPRTRRDLLVREVLRELANRLLLCGEVEVNEAESRYDTAGGEPTNAYTVRVTRTQSYLVSRSG